MFGGFALYIRYPYFTLFMLSILRLIKTCKGPIKILKGPLIVGYIVCMCLNVIFAVVPFKCISSFGPGFSLPYEDQSYTNTDLNYFICDKYCTYMCMYMYKLAF